MSRDGRFVAYGRFVTTPPPIQEIFVHDRDSDGNGVFDEVGGTSTSIVVRGALGQAANNSLNRPVISDDGRYVAFETMADNLDPVIVDDNDAIDIYWTDRDTDGNGITDQADVDAVSARVGSQVSQEGYYYRYDLDRNGIIDQQDMALVRACLDTPDDISQRIFLPLVAR